MIQSLETAEIDPPASVDPCPFCGAIPYWLGVRRADGIVDHFWHPGATNDTDCVLAGQGYWLDQVTNWNRRASEVAK